MERTPSKELTIFDPNWEKRNGIIVFYALLEPKIDSNTNSCYTAFELLQEKVRLSYTMYDGLGAMITGIGDITELPERHYFALFVNGVYAQAGISSIVPTEPIVIEFEVHQY